MIKRTQKMEAIIKAAMASGLFLDEQHLVESALVKLVCSLDIEWASCTVESTALPTIRERPAHMAVNQQVPSGDITSLNTRDPGVRFSVQLPNLDYDNVDTKPVPLSEWPFGGYNIWPLKICLRVILNIAVKSMGKVSIADVRSYVNQLAVVYDSTNARMADGRFMNLGKQLNAMALHLGQEQGLPKKLKLVVTEGARGSIFLTTTGWDFAQVHSQFLDYGGESLELSSEERNILVTHIGKYVPSERRAIQSILYQLHDGHRTAMEIERGLIRAGQLVGLEEELKYSSSFVVTQRAGAIQRLHYLGLLAKAGTRAKALFSITEDGRKFLEQFPGRIPR